MIGRYNPPRCLATHGCETGRRRRASTQFDQRQPARTSRRTDGASGDRQSIMSGRAADPASRIQVPEQSIFVLPNDNVLDAGGCTPHGVDAELLWRAQRLRWTSVRPSTARGDRAGRQPDWMGGRVWPPGDTLIATRREARPAKTSIRGVSGQPRSITPCREFAS